VITHCIHCSNLIEFRQGFWRSTSGTITCPALSGIPAPHQPPAAERLAARVASGATITLDDVAPIARESHPEGLQFVAIDRAVMRGQEHICTAVSNTFARRIARALNLHKPNSRGV
jgi:hypothetical protein